MIWQAAFMDGFYSPGKERLHALGAIDVALWDIKGKALNVPLYQLANAERALERAVGNEMVVLHFRVRHVFASLRTCRLYDYKTHTWHDWDGTPLQKISSRA